MQLNIKEYLMSGALKSNRQCGILEGGGNCQTQFIWELPKISVV